MVDHRPPDPLQRATGRPTRELPAPVREAVEEVGDLRERQLADGQDGADTDATDGPHAAGQDDDTEGPGR